MVVRSLDRTTSTHRGLLLAILLAAAVVVGLLRMVERVVSEQLSQSYVHEIRVGLVRHNLGEDGVRSLGVAVARATNDLSSVKTWVAQGVAPLAVDIPLLMGAWCVLLLLDPVLGLALLAPMALLLLGLRALSPVAYHRSRSVRPGPWAPGHPDRGHGTRHDGHPVGRWRGAGAAPHRTAERVPRRGCRPPGQGGGSTARVGRGRRRTSPPPASSAPAWRPGWQRHSWRPP